MMLSETVAIGDPRYFSFVSGLWKGDKEPLAKAAVLRSTNFRGDGFLCYDDIAELDVRKDQLDSRKLQQGDIIIERSGGGPKQPVGRVALFNPPDNRAFATSNFTTVLRVEDHDSFEPQFVGFFLHALYLSGVTETMQRATTGIRNLDWAEYQSIEVPRLPIDDQRLIACFLRSVHECLDTQGSLLETLAALKRAAMLTLFTKGLRGEAQKETELGPIPESWELKPLGSFGRVGNGSTPKKSVNEYWDGGDFPWLTSAKVYDRDIVSADQFVTQDALEKCHLPIVEPGAILVAITGQGKTLGNCAVLRMRATINQHLAYVATDLSMSDPGYLRGYLETQYDYFRQVGGGGGSTKGALTCAFLRGVPIPCPPTLDEQREIVAILDAIDRKIDLHRRKRAVLDELFKALLHKLMTGEIRVSDLDLSALSADPAPAAKPGATEAA